MEAPQKTGRSMSAVFLFRIHGNRSNPVNVRDDNVAGRFLLKTVISHMTRWGSGDRGKKA